MKIFLIGLPGSGKSTLGKKLAARLGYTFLDTDEEIIKKEGKTIEDIFSREGEKYFRECERNMLATLIKRNKVVISTGGGLPCFFDNMEVINNNGKSIFLDVPVEILAMRLKSHPDQNRPMIKNKSDEELLEFLKAKVKERIPFYSKATLRYSGTNISPEEIIQGLN